MKEIGSTFDVTTRVNASPNEERSYQRLDKMNIKLTSVKEVKFGRSALIGRLNSKGLHIQIKEDSKTNEAIITAIDKNPRTMDITEDFLKSNSFQPEELQSNE